MNNYWHMMEQVTLSDRKKEEIMDMIENKQTQKGRRPSVKVLVLAAALAVGCALSIAAGLPAQVYNFMSGGSMMNMPGSDYGEFVMSPDNPVTLEDGRIWLTANGEKLDITDKMDENTPYIVEHTDKENGTTGYFVAGGTPENFGWVEFPVIDGVIAGSSGCNYEDWWYTMPDGSEILLSDLPMEEQMKLSEENGGGLTFTTVSRPWFQAALDQLGLEY